VATEYPPPQVIDLVGEVEIVRGRVGDYGQFADWHYMGPGRPGPSSDVWLAMHRGRAVGIAMFGYPHLLLGARSGVLPQFAPARIRADGASGLNTGVRLLQRVVVDPRYRGTGVSRRMITHGLQHVGVPYVECIAQMGAFSDFLLGVGFERVCDMPPPRAARRITEFCKQQGISPAALLDSGSRATLLAYLPEDASEELQRLLERLVQSRIETGNGWRRAHANLDREPLLRKALARICAHPAYFLWKDTP
jgi:GNAT superfamily N-acetyltransferase